EVTSPARSSMSSETMVTVTGTAKDDHQITKVTVNGNAATLAADGSFSIAVDVGSGIGIIETHAIDDAGHDVQDVRAVMAGPSGMTDGSVDSPIGARIGAQGLMTIGKAVAKAAEAINFTTEAQGFNPVYDNGGCLGATVNITSVTL